MSETTVNNTEALRTWLLGCPEIAASPGIFGSDYLPDEPGGFTLDSVPSALKYRKNILGEMVLKSEQEQLFVLAARMDYSADVTGNLNNLATFTAIHRWIQDRSNGLPAWEGGTLVAVVPTVTAYPISVGSSTARYQIQIKALYEVSG